MRTSEDPYKPVLSISVPSEASNRPSVNAFVSCGYRWTISAWPRALAPIPLVDEVVVDSAVVAPVPGTDIDVEPPLPIVVEPVVELAGAGSDELHAPIRGSVTSSATSDRQRRDTRRVWTEAAASGCHTPSPYS